MSSYKRYNILQELEQAIKKKTMEKYKNRSKNKLLLCYLESVSTR